VNANDNGNALEIDRSIREAIMGLHPSILAMCLGLEKIKSGDLYKDLDYESMAEYLLRLCEDNKINRSSVYKWLHIGEIYIKYQVDLEKAGFGDSDGPSKLVYLEQALGTREAQEVFAKIKECSVRDFIGFAQNPPGSFPDTHTADPSGPHWDSGFYADGIPAVCVNRALDKPVYDYFRRVIREAVKAIEEEGFILPVLLKSRTEVRIYRRASARLLARMRKKMQKKVS